MSIHTMEATTDDSTQSDCNSPKIESCEVAVAGLTSAEISSMSRAQLVETIRMVRMPVLRDEVNLALAAYERDTLERLVFLTQRYCRHRLGGKDHGFHYTPWHIACTKSDQNTKPQ